MRCCTLQKHFYAVFSILISTSSRQVVTALGATAATSGVKFDLSLRRPVPEWALPPFDEAPQSCSGSCAVPLIGVVTTLKSHVASVDVFLRTFDFAQVVVAGDASSEEYVVDEEFLGRIHVLSLQLQHELYKDFSESLPVNSFARKNVGYLHAIALGACNIWDFDDDNVVTDAALLQRIGQTGHIGQNGTGNFFLHSNKFRAVNPYLIFGPDKHVYPRGYPIEFLEERDFPVLHVPETLGLEGVEAFTIDVVQVLQDKDPDVDALWRLQNKLPLFWQTPQAIHDKPLSITPGAFAPYNAQATLFSRKAFWSMYLPHTVHGRVSDIWRSYLAQHLFPAVKSLVAFSSTAVDHLRNSHDYMKDFNAEKPLYEQSGELLRYLSKRTPSQPQGHAGGSLLDLYTDLYARGMFDVSELQSLSLWVKALQSVAYCGPSVGSHATNNFRRELLPSFNTTLAVVQINHQHWQSAVLWKATVGSFLPNSVFYAPGTAPCPTVAGLTFRCISGDTRGLVAYESVYHASNSFNAFENFLFLHDDAIVDLSFFYEQGIQRRKSIALQAHDYYAKNGAWLWDDNVTSQMSFLEKNLRVAQSPDLYRVLQLNKSGLCTENSFVFFAQSDVYLLTREDAVASEVAARAFLDAKLFLEVAVPTLNQCIWSAENYNLLTVWNASRFDSDFLCAQYCASSSHQVVHPVKLSTGHWLHSYIIAANCKFIRGKHAH